MNMILRPSKQSGFTLVEIAFAMIIIGLLIGGVLGAKKIKENAEAMSIIKDLKTFESSALKFRDLYGDLPGDINDPSSRLSNCNAAPCNKGGDGDKTIDCASGTCDWFDTATTSSERFVLWSQMLASGLVTKGFTGADNMISGEGLPASDLGLNYTWISDNTSLLDPTAVEFSFNNKFTRAFGSPLNFITLGGNGPINKGVPCYMVLKIDKKIDDGISTSQTSRVQSGCDYNNTASTAIYSDYGTLILVLKVY